MTPAARERVHVRTPVLFLSGAAWILLAVQPGGMAHSHHAGAAMAALNAPVSLAMGWALMLAAMMAPMLIAPVRHVRDRSFARRRVRATVIFVAAYTAIWMVAGAILLAAAMALRQVAPGSWVPVGLVAAVALVWQFSPLKQRCLNRGHAHPELAAFGRAADLSALRFGLSHGVWCVGSCWALMLLPLLVARGHLVAMAAVALWLFAERLDRPMPPQWRWRGPGKAASRIIFAQARMRLQRV